MELRKLKALLAALRTAGVTSYRDADLTLEFGVTPLEVPRGDVEVPDEWAPRGAPMGLQQAVERIQKEYAVKPRKGAQ